MKPWPRLLPNPDRLSIRKWSQILQRRYVEWEKLARLQPLQVPPKLSTDIKVERGLAPAAGFADSAEASRNRIAGSWAPRNVSPQRGLQAQGLTELGHGARRCRSLSMTLFRCFRCG